MVLPALFVVFGVMLVIQGFWHIAQDRRQRREWTATDGIVVSLAEREVGVGARRRTVYCPIVEFTGDDGMRRQFDAGIGARPAWHRVGQTMRVLYPAGSPSSARLDPGSDWSNAVPAFLMGVALIVVGALFMWLARDPSANMRSSVTDLDGDEPQVSARVDGFRSAPRSIRVAYAATTSGSSANT